MTRQPKLTALAGILVATASACYQFPNILPKSDCAPQIDNSWANTNSERRPFENQINLRTQNGNLQTQNLGGTNNFYNPAKNPQGNSYNLHLLNDQGQIIFTNSFDLTSNFTTIYFPARSDIARIEILNEDCKSLINEELPIYLRFRF